VYTKYYSDSLKGGIYLRELRTHGIIYNINIEFKMIRLENVGCINMAQEKNQPKAAMGAVRNLRVPEHVGYVSTS
jgi:hypothetical protein